MRRYTYVGDVNIEHGGYFVAVTREEYAQGYANVVRVTPCSDAGAQDNCFWINELTVIIPKDAEKMAQTLRCVGWHIDEQGCIVSESLEEIAKPRTAGFRAAVVDACVAYGAYDQDSSTCVSIGKPDPDYRGREPVEPDTVLRANTDLKRYVRRTYLRNQ